MIRARFSMYRPAIEDVPCNYIVALWDETRDAMGEILAMTNNGIIAAAAFDAACTQRSGPLVLRNGSRVISKR